MDHRIRLALHQGSLEKLSGEVEADETFFEDSPIGLEPPTIAERIKDYRAQNVADWVMYRKALGAAAEARGWAVHWYDAKKVFDAASEALRIDYLDSHFLQLRRSIGSPWSKDHKLAMAAAIVAARARSR